MTDMPAKMSRDIAWITQTCTLGYDVMGESFSQYTGASSQLVLRPSTHH